MKIFFCKMIVIAIAGLALTACDSGSSDNVHSDYFTGIPAEGLDYTTKRFSETTDASGHFSYLENEKVSFSIGKLVLGDVIANDQITPWKNPRRIPPPLP